jgi:hypothetical protein
MNPHVITEGEHAELKARIRAVGAAVGELKNNYVTLTCTGSGFSEQTDMLYDAINQLTLGFRLAEHSLFMPVSIERDETQADVATHDVSDGGNQD